MKQNRKKKKRNFSIITCALSIMILSISLYTYIRFSSQVSAYETHIKNIKINSNIGDDYLTNFEKEQIEKEKQKEEEKIKKEEERKEKLEEQKKVLKELEEKKRDKKKKEMEKKLSNDKEKSSNLKSNIMNVEIIKQLPELKNGCEVTSVAMMLNHFGIKVDKMTLAEKVKKDNTKIEYDENGKIIKWGNPDIGFVGDITGVSSGYSINPIPLLELVNQYVKGVNLTNLDYSYIEKSLSENRPVVVWVTSDFTSPQINTSWKNNGETVTAYFNQHAVLLTGYDAEYLYYNDPLTGKINDKIEKDIFLKIWTNTGRKAITCELKNSK